MDQLDVQGQASEMYRDLYGRVFRSSIEHLSRFNHPDASIAHSLEAESPMAEEDQFARHVLGRRVRAAVQFAASPNTHEAGQFQRPFM